MVHTVGIFGSTTTQIHHENINPSDPVSDGRSSLIGYSGESDRFSIVKK